MRIKDVDNVRAKHSKKTDKVKSSPETNFSNYLNKLSNSEEASEASGNVTPVSEVSSILLAQEIPQDSSAGSQNKNLFTRGEALLDQLGIIRDGLLAGSLPADKLKELTKILNEEKTINSDPQLSEIIDEIELRAEVELAKLLRKD